MLSWHRSAFMASDGCQSPQEGDRIRVRGGIITVYLCFDERARTLLTVRQPRGSCTDARTGPSSLSLSILGTSLSRSATLTTFLRMNSTGEIIYIPRLLGRGADARFIVDAEKYAKRNSPLRTCLTTDPLDGRAASVSLSLSCNQHAASPSLSIPRSNASFKCPALPTTQIPDENLLPCSKIGRHRITEFLD